MFTSPDGAPLRNGNFRRRIWYPAVEQAGLPHGLRIHDLRHTCASLLIAAGANSKAVQTHLGHSSITVTMDRYTHRFPSTSTTSSDDSTARMINNAATSAKATHFICCRSTPLARRKRTTTAATDPNIATGSKLASQLAAVAIPGRWYGLGPYSGEPPRWARTR